VAGLRGRRLLDKMAAREAVADTASARRPGRPSASTAVAGA
jgi:hypothetical protein